MLVADPFSPTLTKKTSDDIMLDDKTHKAGIHIVPCHVHHLRLSIAVVCKGRYIVLLALVAIDIPFGATFHAGEEDI